MKERTLDQKEQKNRSYLGAVVLIFLASAVLRGVLAVQFGERIIFMDELLHWQAGFSLSRGSLLFRGFPLNYSELLYAGMLSLCQFFFRDGQAAYLAALVLNAAVTSLGVFPVYFLSRRVTKDARKSLLICVIVMCAAELTITMRLFQENLHFPLMMGYFCLFARVTEREKPSFAGMAGLGAYTVLLAVSKQMALNLVVGMGVYFVYLLAAEKGRRKRNLAQAGVYLTTFGGVWGAYNLLFLLISRPEGAMKTAGTISRWAEYLFDPSHYATALQTGLFYLMGTLLLMGVFAALIPCALWKKLSAPQKRLLVLSLAAAVSTMAVLSALLTADEGTGRLHYRYYWYVFVPLLALCFSQQKNLSREGLRPPLLFGGIGVLAGLVLLPFLPPGSAHVDAPSTWIFTLLHNRLGMEVLRFLLVSAVLAGLALLYYKKVRIFYGALAAALILMGGVGSALIYRSMAAVHAGSQPVNAAARQVNDYLLDHMDPEKESLLVVGTDISQTAAVECWLQVPYYFCQLQDLIPGGAGEIVPAQTVLTTLGSDDLYRQTDHTRWDYLFSSTALHLEGYDLALETPAGRLYRLRGERAALPAYALTEGIYGDSWVGEGGSLKIVTESGALEALFTFQADTMVFDRVEAVFTDGTGASETLAITQRQARYQLSVRRASPQEPFVISIAPEKTFVPAETMAPGGGDLRALSFRILSYDVQPQDGAPES